jgi:hypothetical protein
MAQGIGIRPRGYTGGFQPGMTMTDEPGYYEDGAFGIRIESVLITRVIPREPESAYGKFLEFENITCMPIQTKLVDASLLNDFELSWLNGYNAWCLATVSRTCPAPSHLYIHVCGVPANDVLFLSLLSPLCSSLVCPLSPHSLSP